MNAINKQWDEKLNSGTPKLEKIMQLLNRNKLDVFIQRN